MVFGKKHFYVFLESTTFRLENRLAFLIIVPLSISFSLPLSLALFYLSLKRINTLTLFSRRLTLSHELSFFMSLWNTHTLFLYLSESFVHSLFLPNKLPHSYTLFQSWTHYLRDTFMLNLPYAHTLPLSPSITFPRWHFTELPSCHNTLMALHTLNRTMMLRHF